MTTSTTATPCPTTTRCWEGRSQGTACMAGPPPNSTRKRRVCDDILGLKFRGVQMSVYRCHCLSFNLILIEIQLRVYNDLLIEYCAKSVSDYSRDASYIGKILEGFTLSSGTEKERKVSSFCSFLLTKCLILTNLSPHLVCLVFCLHPPSIPPSRSSPLPSCPGTSGQCTTSVRWWICPASAPSWPRP